MVTETKTGRRGACLWAALMLAVLLALALLGPGSTGAHAQVVSGTRVIIRDPVTGAELGTATHPLVTSVSGGGGSSTVTGNVASAAADSGNPVKIGCVYNGSPSSVSNGQRVDCQADIKGNIATFVMGQNTNNGADVRQVASDGLASGYGLNVVGQSFVYNGSTWDRLRGSTSGVYTVAQAAENHIGQVGGAALNPSANFTRPSDTTAYASGDLVANSTTAGSVTCLSFTAARVSAGSFMIRRAKLATSSTSVTNASFRLHLFRACPATVTNGDNGAFSVSGVADYVGAFDISVDRAFTDGAAGFGLPVVGSEQTIKLASGSAIYGLLEARAAYTPTSAGTFTVTLDDLVD